MISEALINGNLEKFFKFFMDRVAVFRVKITLNHYLRGPLVRGVLRIPHEKTTKN